MLGEKLLEIHIQFDFVFFVENPLSFLLFNPGFLFLVVFLQLSIFVENNSVPLEANLCLSLRLFTNSQRKRATNGTDIRYRWNRLVGQSYDGAQIDLT